MQYYKCQNCGLNYCKVQGEICSVCKKAQFDSGICLYCGGMTEEGVEVCPICKESLVLERQAQSDKNDDEAQEF